MSDKNVDIIFLREEQVFYDSVTQTTVILKSFAQRINVGKLFISFWLEKWPLDTGKVNSQLKHIDCIKLSYKRKHRKE